MSAEKLRIIFCILVLEITFLVSLTQQQSLKLPENLDFAKAVDFMKIFQAKLPSNVLTEKDFENYMIAKNYVLEKRREYLERKRLKERLFPWYMRRVSG
jgi:hypothetical protein